MANIGERYVAEVKDGARHFRLFSQMERTGIVAVVYDLRTRQELLSESVSSFDEGKRLCEDFIKGMLGKLGQKCVWTHQP